MTEERALLLTVERIIDWLDKRAINHVVFQEQGLTIIAMPKAQQLKLIWDKTDD